MRDEETGTFWQQITGRAISGPLRGRELSLVRNDELTFALWRNEQPAGKLLAPVQKYEGHYEKPEWEESMGKVPTVVHAPRGTLPDRELIVGVTSGSAARAYPFAAIEAQAPILDKVGDAPVLVILAPDRRSVRVFRPELAGRVLSFYRDVMRGGLLDEQTLSSWNFSGCASDGPYKGRCLEPVTYLKDYWFDWHLYHPESTIYRAGNPSF